ncbi:MAG TPA: zinc dependent phospholipase C family protein [Terriglobales bacterium]|nr:zinc dependent phospholipase C family protein [Terriglobales bacterium]
MRDHMHLVARRRERQRAARAITVSLLMCAALLSAHMALAYSVLTHEQVVDLLWKDQIEPLLKKRFPQATEQDLQKAHAYAYGGSMIQDMGYYPFGNKFFSDLLHYVRSGDFVMNLINDSSDPNEYAFALGALAHYASDNSGHPTVNRVVALEFPKLGKKYGDEVTYGDDPKAHIRTEFGFDMVEVARNRYTSDRYHDFIGFEIAQGLLERTFAKTYGLNLDQVIHNEDLAIGTFRWSVSRAIPQMTRVALLNRKEEMVKEDPNFDRKKFLYYLSRAKYEKEWGKEYRRPGSGARVLAFILKIMPKIGPFKAAAFKVPTGHSEDLYIKSVNRTVEAYRTLLQEVGRERLHLENLDCDTGKPTRPGEYALSDQTYGRLVDRLAEHDFDRVSPELRSDLLHYYAQPDSPASSGKNRKQWPRVRQQLERLRTAANVAPGERE